MTKIIEFCMRMSASRKVASIVNMQHNDVDDDVMEKIEGGNPWVTILENSNCALPNSQHKYFCGIEANQKCVRNQMQNSEPNNVPFIF